MKNRRMSIPGDETMKLWNYGKLNRTRAVPVRARVLHRSGFCRPFWPFVFVAVWVFLTAFCSSVMDRSAGLLRDFTCVSYFIVTEVPSVDRLLRQAFLYLLRWLLHLRLKLHYSSVSSFCFFFYPFCCWIENKEGNFFYDSRECASKAFWPEIF